MTVATTPFDPADYLDSPAAIAAYLADAFEEGDPAGIADALGVIARAGNLSEVARQAGLHRQTLYKAFTADGNPELGTVMRALKALGVRLTTVPITVTS